MTLNIQDADQGLDNWHSDVSEEVCSPVTLVLNTSWEIRKQAPRRARVRHSRWRSGHACRRTGTYWSLSTPDKCLKKLVQQSMHKELKFWKNYAYYSTLVQKDLSKLHRYHMQNWDIRLTSTGYSHWSVKWHNMVESQWNRVTVSHLRDQSCLVGFPKYQY